MNQTFSPTRFGRLLSNYFIANWGQLFAGLALLLGVMTVGFIMVYSQTPIEVDKLRQPLLFLFGWLTWYLFTWQQVEVLNHKERSITYLLQPASQLEKMLLIWFITSIFFLLVYLACFTLLDTIGISYINHRDWSASKLEEIRVRGGLRHLTPFYKSTYIDMTGLIGVSTLLLHPFALAFFLVFRRYSLAMVSALAFVLVVFLSLGNSFIVHHIANIQDAVTVRLFGDAIVRSPDQRSYRTIGLPQPLGDQLRYTVAITVCVLLYITAYFRLKEREV